MRPQKLCSGRNRLSAEIKVRRTVRVAFLPPPRCPAACASNGDAHARSHTSSGVDDHPGLYRARTSARQITNDGNANVAPATATYRSQAKCTEYGGHNISTFRAEQDVASKLAAHALAVSENLTVFRSCRGRPYSNIISVYPDTQSV